MNHSRRTVLKLAGAGLVGLGGPSLVGTAAAQTTYTVDSDLTNTVSATGAELDEAVRGVRSDSPLVGLGDTWVAVGNEEGINAVYMAAHAAWESAWGTSTIAQDKNNIYGWGAVDSDPYDGAKAFDSFDECVRYVMPRIKDLYLSPDGQYYTSHGPTLRGMNVHYATDDNWADGIAGVMNSIADELPSGGDGGFGDGDRVVATEGLNTREQPGLDSEVVATMAAGSVGEIVNGPTAADGYTWWGIHWLERDIWGWSVEQYLDPA
ncbi:glucosaminidase domain-containing protein [Halegenticoccus tardaugens]|uniref:glucosaminidase domain-containing protein n=1 Tax=Halegenticoccus tardaugens TaxID=2071624 RepID=UPI00100BAF40|nr:glucosaminidase domain-containing protein [Halegenticoccus tardaugens]